MSPKDAEKWNAIYRAGKHDQAEAAKVLREHNHLLPQTGKALDLACGRGANALFLAHHGLETSAWDVSDQAIALLEQSARELRLRLDTEVRDVIERPPKQDSFDVIVVSHFLERAIFPALCLALRTGGLLYYQTFIREQVSATGPSNPAYRLTENELLSLCMPLHIVYYREEGRIGNTAKGFRDQAMLIGQRR